LRKEIVLGGKPVAYELSIKRVKNLNLRIRADGSVAVSAPRNVSLSFIERFLLSNEEKILRALAEQEQKPSPPQYKDGELLPVLGVWHRLKVLESGKNRAEIKGEELWFFVKDPENAELRKKTAEAFYKELCAQHMPQICRKLLPHFSSSLESMPEIRYRRMKSRWGSCTPKKKSVCFNSLLAMSPPECMELVAAHEFCHFVHADHSRKFYSCLSAIMPDWKERKAKLREYSALIK